MNDLVHCSKLGYLNYELETIKDAMDEHIRYSTVILDPKTGRRILKIAVDIDLKRPQPFRKIHEARNALKKF